MTTLLDTIHSPADLRQLKRSDLPQLARELREFIVESVSKTGGHFASNLGSVELTVALHYLFDANVALLQDLAQAQLVTSAQARWNTLKEVLGLLWNQLTMFIPGRIGLLLAAWQSELTVLQIIDRATEGYDSGHWGVILSER